jgi:hypothetical protein
MLPRRSPFPALGGMAKRRVLRVPNRADLDNRNRKVRSDHGRAELAWPEQCHSAVMPGWSGSPRCWRIHAVLSWRRDVRVME